MNAATAIVIVFMSFLFNSRDVLDSIQRTTRQEDHHVVYTETRSLASIS
jgi:hypothetical protein